MTVVTIVAAVLAAGLLAYLFYTLIRTEGHLCKKLTTIF